MPTIGFKIVENEIASLRHFLPRRHLFFFFGCFLFGPLEFLGAFWAAAVFLRVSWEVSGPKTVKKHRVLSGFLKAVVWRFKAHDGPLPLIFFLLFFWISSCAKMLVQIVFQNWNFLEQQLSRIAYPKIIVTIFFLNIGFFLYFFVHIWSQKIVQNSFKKCQFLGSIFESFVGGFGDLWVCLGSLFGSLEVFLGGLLIQKTIKNCGFF